MSANRLVSELYTYYMLNDEQKKYLIEKVINHYGKDRTLNWPSNREEVIIPFLKSLIEIPLNAEENDKLKDVNNRLQFIENGNDLDTCLMFWLITRQPAYRNFIIKTTGVTDQLLRNQALMIVRHYSL